MSLQRLVRNTGLSFVFIVFGALLGYFFRRYLALHLAVADYGLFFSILAFFSVLMLFVDLGLEAATAKMLIELRLKKEYHHMRSLVFSILCVQLLLSFVLYAAVFFLSDFLAESYFHAPSAGLLIRLLGIWFFTTPLIIFIAALLLGFERTTWYTALDFFRMLFVFLSTLLFFFFFEEGILAPVLAYAIINIILFCLYVPYLFSFFPHLFRISFSLEKEQILSVFSYGFLIALTSFGWLIITQTDVLTLTYLSTLENVGLYNVALPLSLLLLLFMRPIIAVYYPYVTSLVAQKKFSALGDAITLVYRYIFAFLLPFSLILIVFPEEVISFLFSEKYIAAAPVLSYLSIGMLFYALSLFNSIVFNGLGKAKYMACCVGGIAILNLLLNIILIPIFGITGAALATMVSYILLSVISCFLLYRLVSFSFSLFSWFKIFLSGILSMLFVLLLKIFLHGNTFFEAILCITLLLLCYSFLLYFLKVIDFKQFFALLKQALS